MVLMPAPIAMVWATEVLVLVMVATEDTTTVKHPEIVKLSETKTQQNLFSARKGRIQLSCF